MAVRFKPGAAGIFLRTPLHALTDCSAGIDLLWGRADAGRIDDALWTRELSDRQLIDLIEAQLLRRLQDACADRQRSGAPGPAGAALIQQALQALDASGGTLRIDDLAAQLGVSRQHLAARFRDQVGLSPKLYARLLKQSGLWSLAPPDSDLHAPAR